MYGLHDPQEWMSVNVLQWKVDEMSLRIDGDRVRVRHVELTQFTKSSLALLKDSDCTGLRGHV